MDDSPLHPPFTPFSNPCLPRGSPCEDHPNFPRRRGRRHRLRGEPSKYPMRAPTGGGAISRQNFPRARRGTPHRESRPSEAGFLASGKAGDRWGLAFARAPGAPDRNAGSQGSVAAATSTPGGPQWWQCEKCFGLLVYVWPFWVFTRTFQSLAFFLCVHVSV